MAGNTKLIGFGPDIKNPGKYLVKLARWGGETTVEVAKEVVRAFDEACRNALPTKPHQYEHIGGDFKARYNENFGRVDMEMSIEGTKSLCNLISFYVERMEGVPDSEDGVRDANELLDMLLTQVKAHADYLNEEGEPGVEDTH